MQDNNENRAMEIARDFAHYMGMANWEPQDNFVEALAYEIALAMSFEESLGIEAREALLDALQYASQRVGL